MLKSHNVMMKPSNMRKKKKSKGTAQCEKITVTYNVGIAQCEDETIKCEKKVIWYSRLPTSEYRTPPFWGGYHRITHSFNIYQTKKRKMD